MGGEGGRGQEEIQKPITIRGPKGGLRARARAAEKGDDGGRRGQAVGDDI